MSHRIAIISGPTASGKSDLALKMADLGHIAIINADSLQIYRALPILSSQPSLAEQKKVPHFLYSHFSPAENSSVAIWLNLLESIIERLWNENKLPVIVGGSGMYISKLVEGISEIPQISDAVKKQARQLYDELGHEEFKRFTQGQALDKQRLIREYEVLLQSGKPISAWQKNQKKLFPHAEFLHINLNPDRQQLYENCNLRFEKMLNCGAIEEVQSLVKQGMEDDWQIVKTLGFFEIRDYLDNKISRQKMLEMAQQKTRNYAKRQLTWFRHQLPQKHVFTDSAAALNFLSNEI